MINTNELLKNILSDMKVELTEMFDRNFERKGFFNSKKWEARKIANSKGSLLHVTGKMRRSIRSSIKSRGVHFSSALPYTSLHNTGGEFSQNVRTHNRTNRKTGKTHSVKSHTRAMNMPQRQFIGDHQEVQKVIRGIIEENINQFFSDLAKEIKK